MILWHLRASSRSIQASPLLSSMIPSTVFWNFRRLDSTCFTKLVNRKLTGRTWCPPPCPTPRCCCLTALPLLFSLSPFSYLTLYCPIVNENSGPRRVTHHMFYSVQKIAVLQRKKRVVLTLPHGISNPKSLISLQPTKAFMRLS